MDELLPQFVEGIGPWPTSARRCGHAPAIPSRQWISRDAPLVLVQADDEEIPRQFVRRLGSYHRPAIGALEPLRRAWGYENRREVIPDSSNKAVGVKATYEQRVTVPAGAFLWAIAGTSQQPEGFRLQIIDTASGRGLLSQPAHFSAIAGGASYPIGVKNCYGTAVIIRQALYVLPKPRVIIEPGMLRVQITNLSAAVNTIQVVLHFAAPPVAGAPRNEWNAICEAEVELARRALRGQVLVTPGQPGAPAQGIGADQSDPMNQPAANIPFNVSAAGDNLILSGTQGYRIAVHQLSLYSTANQTVRLLDGDTDLMGPIVKMQAGSGYFLPYQDEPHFVLTDGRSFIINLAPGDDPVGAVTGFAKYRMLERWGS